MDKSDHGIHEHEMKGKQKCKHKREIPEEEQEEFRESFNMIDTDRNGSISKEELKKLLVNLNCDVTDAEIKEMIDEHDMDESGEIEFDEFIDMFQKIKDAHDKTDTMRTAFEAFDQDGSGKISAEELRTVMNRLGETLSDEQIEDMITAADTDRDGQIDYAEFLAMMGGGYH